MTTKYKLALIPEGCRVVPEEPTEDQLDAGEYWTYDAKWVYDDMLEKAPQLTTPPVLRWEGDELYVGNTYLAAVTTPRTAGSGYFWSCIKDLCGYVDSIEQARRAAEKALGFPEGLIVE